jgi:hypothetical protein
MKKTLLIMLFLSSRIYVFAQGKKKKKAIWYASDPHASPRIVENDTTVLK